MIAPFCLAQFFAFAPNWLSRNNFCMDQCNSVHVWTGLNLLARRQLLSSNEWLPSAQWTENNVVVLRRKDSEPRSCRVLYDMQVRCISLCCKNYKSRLGCLLPPLLCWLVRPKNEMCGAREREEWRKTKSTWFRLKSCTNINGWYSIKKEECE